MTPPAPSADLPLDFLADPDAPAGGVLGALAELLISLAEREAADDHQRLDTEVPSDG